MATSSVNIKINTTEQEKEGLYSSISINCELTKEKLSKNNETLSQICGTAKVPFVVVEMPTADFKGKKLPFFEGERFTFTQKQYHNKIYQYGELKNEQSQKFTHNLEKAFRKLTELNNTLDLEFKFYKVREKLEDSSMGMQLWWDKLKIEGKASLENGFCEVLKQQLEKVSPSFASSPLVVFLELLDTIEINATLQQMDDSLSEAVKYLANLLRGQEKAQINESITELMKETSEPITVYFSVEKLFHIKVCAPAMLFLAILTRI